MSYISSFNDLSFKRGWPKVKVASMLGALLAILVTKLAPPMKKNVSYASDTQLIKFRCKTSRGLPWIWNFRPRHKSLYLVPISIIHRFCLSCLHPLFLSSFYQSSWINFATVTTMFTAFGEDLRKFDEGFLTKVRTLESILIYTYYCNVWLYPSRRRPRLWTQTDDCTNGPTVCLIDSHAWQSLFISPPWGQVWHHWQRTIHCIYPGNVIACDTAVT